MRDSDATLVLAIGTLSGGTALTVRAAEQAKKPVRVVDPNDAPCVADVEQWIRSEEIGVLNVAGPRESGSPGIYDRASVFLRELFSRFSDEDPR